MSLEPRRRRWRAAERNTVGVDVRNGRRGQSCEDQSSHQSPPRGCPLQTGERERERETARCPRTPATQSSLLDSNASDDCGVMKVSAAVTRCPADKSVHLLTECRTPSSNTPLVVLNVDARPLEGCKLWKPFWGQFETFLLPTWKVFRK